MSTRYPLNQSMFCLKLANRLKPSLLGNDFSHININVLKCSEMSCSVLKCCANMPTRKQCLEILVEWLGLGLGLLNVSYFDEEERTTLL